MKFLFKTVLHKKIGIVEGHSSAGMPRPHTRGDASNERQTEEIARLVQEVEEIDVSWSSIVLLGRACDLCRFRLTTTDADRGGL